MTEPSRPAPRPGPSQSAADDGPDPSPHPAASDVACSWRVTSGDGPHAPLRFDLGGTLRARPAADTLARLRTLLPAFGITRVANVTGLDCVGIPVAVCVRPNARLLTVSQGKGLDDDLAAISAIMESIEVHHAETVRPPDAVASFDEIRCGHRALDPATLPGGLRARAYVPARPIAWTRGRDLVRGGDIFVPHALVSLDPTTTHPDAGLFAGNSNGLASGNTLDEALCHGLCELVERDALWRWYHLSPAEQHARSVRTDTVDGPVARGLLERLTRAGLAAHVWDVTSPLGLPAFRCTLVDRDPWRGLGAFSGAGCHLVPEVALCRALTEAAQTRLTLISGSRDDVLPEHYAEQRSVATRLPPADRGGVADFRAIVAPPLGADFADDVRAIVARLAAHGYHDVAAVEHAPAELGFAVVHVVVPGLQFDGLRL